MEPKMRLVLTMAGLDSARLSLRKGRRAWDKPGQTMTSSTALHGEFNDEGACDLEFYKQKHQCWVQVGPAKVLYSEGEGAFNHDTAKAALEAEGAELRMRTRGQHAT
eukprot:8945667-Pyramimonas_sp.AAC.1